MIIFLTGFQAEGVFRKTGSLTQQRTVTEALLHPAFDCTTFGWTEFSPHELAGALKSVIGHLAQPLLTSTLTPLFLEAARTRLFQCCHRNFAFHPQSFDAISIQMHLVLVNSFIFLQTSLQMYSGHKLLS